MILVKQLIAHSRYFLLIFIISGVVVNFGILSDLKSNSLWKSDLLVLEQDTLPVTLQHLEDIQSSNDNELERGKEREIFYTVQQMPYFPGCEDLLENSLEVRRCTNEKMLYFIYEHINYPLKARMKGLTGRVVVSFVVTDEGYIEDAKILRDIGGGCGDEVLRVLALMNKMSDRWVPGKQDGKSVNVQMTLPVEFRFPKEGESLPVNR